VTGAARHSRGFTLIEVLVALALLAICMTGLMSVFGDSLARAGDSEAEHGAIAVARSVLARAGREWSLDETLRQGVEGGYRWRLDSTPEPPARQDELPPVKAFRLAVTVAWNGAWRERSLDLVTLRLAPRE
jgi:prepilin-type N-terminal cleavage/methylation domain-containing protein